MKLKFALLLLCGFTSLNASAHGIGAISLLQEKRWTAVQVGIWPLQLFDAGTNVYGLNCNLFLTYQNRDIYGLSIAPFNFCGGNVRGVTIGLSSSIEGHHSGIIVSLLSRTSSNKGIQINKHSPTEVRRAMKQVRRQRGNDTTKGEYSGF